MAETHTDKPGRDISGKILAVDYGTKTVGLAAYLPGSDPYPLPFSQLAYVDDDALARDIVSIVREQDAAAVVLGVPRMLDGRESSMTRRVLSFSERLEQALQPVPLYRQDETLSTYEAEERMKSSPLYNFKVDPARIDELAAVVILEDFISR